MASHLRCIPRAVLAAFLVLLVLSLAPAIVPAPGSGIPLTHAQGVDERQAQEIAKLLKCPVCQNLSVADSPSPLAEQMRGIINERLAAGQSRDEILAYFVDRYGEEVLLDPPKHGFSQIIWWGAGAGFLAGAAGVAWFVYGRLRQSGGTLDEALVSDADLRAYESVLEQEIATGTPDLARATDPTPGPSPRRGGETQGTNLPLSAPGRGPGGGVSGQPPSYHSDRGRPA